MEGSVREVKSRMKKDSVTRLWLLFLNRKGGSLKTWSAPLNLMLEVIALAMAKARGFCQCDIEAHGSFASLGFLLWVVYCSFDCLGFSRWLVLLPTRQPTLYFLDNTVTNKLGLIRGPQRKTKIL
jgi:hypothetical protein